MSASDLKRLSAEHRRALNAYARKHGRTWRAKLLTARAKGGYGIEGPLVHAVNLVGPSGIRAYRVTEENPGRKRPRKAASKASAGSLYNVRLFDPEVGSFRHYARMRGTSAKDVGRRFLAKWAMSGDPNWGDMGPTEDDISVVKATSRKVANPFAACERVTPRFNAHQGRTINYRGADYEVDGCGIGNTAHRAIGQQTEGAARLRNLKTGKSRYVAKRVIRDIKYHRGADGVLGAALRKPRAKKTPKRKSAKGRR
jgi:hypothetical protein